MNLKDIKLVVTDMDGTLLNSSAQLPRNFDKILARMRRHNIAFVLASGRQIQNMKIKFSDPAVMNEIYFVAENGAYATYGSEELLELSLNKEEIINFRKIALTIKDSYIVLSGKKLAYIENCEPEFLAKLRSYSGYLHSVEDVSEISDDKFFKFTLCDLKDPHTNSLPHFLKFKDSFQVEVSGTKWMDITCKDANKGNAVKLIQKRLGIAPEQTVVFGDYLNDKEMLKNTPHSFAMSNAIEDIKAICKYQIGSNDEESVALTLDKILPI